VTHLGGRKLGAAIHTLLGNGKNSKSHILNVPPYFFADLKLSAPSSPERPKQSTAPSAGFFTRQSKHDQEH
jgi:hypothetical protein